MVQASRPLLAVKGAYPRAFKEWGISVTLLKGEDGDVYFPVRQLCEALGVDANTQLIYLRSDEDAQPGLVDMKVYSGDGGMQRSMCIRRLECAWWLAHISPKRVRADIRDDLRAIRDVLKRTAEALIFADITQAPESERGVIAVSSHDVLVLACPECGIRWRITIVNGEASIEPEA